MLPAIGCCLPCYEAPEVKVSAQEHVQHGFAPRAQKAQSNNFGPFLGHTVTRSRLGSKTCRQESHKQHSSRNTTGLHACVPSCRNSDIDTVGAWALCACRCVAAGGTNQEHAWQLPAKIVAAAAVNQCL